MGTARASFGLVDWSRKLLPHAVVVVAAAFACRRLDDADTWWHLASGRWIVAHRAVPVTDTLSFTVPDQPWVNVQWLYDVLLYGLYQWGGSSLLVLASTVAFAAAIWLLTRNVGLFVGNVTTAVLTLAVVLVAQERFIIRPEMLSFVLLEALLWLLLTLERTAGRHIWLLAPLMLVWVNCHSLFIVGMFCIACAALAPLLSRLPVLPAGWRAASRLEPKTERRLLIASLAAVLASLVNPYGIEGLLFPFRLLSRIDPNDPVFQSIAEFRPPFSGFVTTPSVWVYRVFFVGSSIVVALAVLLGTGRGRRYGQGANLAHLAMFAGLAYLSLLARRNMAIFVLVAAPLVASCLASLAAGLPLAVQRLAKPAARAFAPALLASCVVLVLALATNHYYRWSGQTREFGVGTLEVNFPIRAAAFARELRLPPRIYNDLTAGGYLAWERPVGGGVFIDGRLEVYERPFFARYLHGLVDPAVWQRQADRFGVNTALIFHRWSSRRRLVRSLVSNPRWSLVYHDEVAVIFVRSGGHQQLVSDARRRFDLRYAETLAALRAAPQARWQWPIARAAALESYAGLHLLLGQTEQAMELYDRLFEIGLRPVREVSVRYRIAKYFAGRGFPAEAQAQLRIAAAREPQNARVQALQDELAGAPAP